MQDPQLQQALMQDPQGTAQQLGIPPDALPQIMQMLQQSGQGAPGGQPPPGGAPAGPDPQQAQAMAAVQQQLEMVMQKLQASDQERKELAAKFHDLEIKFARLDSKTEVVLKTVKELDIPSEPPAPAAPAQPDSAAAMGGPAAMGVPVA